MDSQGQTISYCGFNTYLQNGIVKKRIRDLQEQERKQILHVKSIRNYEIELNLWTYALQNENEIRNNLTEKDEKPPQ